MRIFDNNEIKPQANYKVNLLKHKGASDRGCNVQEQGHSVSKDNESDRYADLLDISNEARRLHEEMERMKENAEASGKAMEDLGKILEIARRIANGDRVPSTDEKKLMEYNSDLYQAAKAAALLKANEKQKEHDSLFSDENDNKKKDSLNGTENVDATVSNIINTFEATDVSIESDVHI